ncbi:MAG: efflux RND transporter permease subunit [Desulfobacterales bacterium]
MNDHAPETRLNPSGKLAKTFLHTKITPLIMLGIALFGMMAVLITPRLYNPEIVVPAAQIIVVRPGNSPEQILAQVVRPLEQLMFSLKNVKHTYGYAVNDRGVVMVEFEVGADEIASLMYLYNELQRNMDRLPPGTKLPLVKSMGINDVPIVAITLSSKSFSEPELRRIAQLFLNQLHSVPDTGVSSVIGTEPEAVKILVDPRRLSANGISLNDLLDTLNGSNVILPGGHLEAQNERIPLRVDATFGAVSELGNIVVGARQGKPVLLRDVATIERGAKNEELHAWLAFGQGQHAESVGDPANAVTITIGKRSRKNSVKVAEEILGKLKTLKREALPEGVKLTITRNYGQRANEAVNTLIEHLGIAIIAVLIILLLFLGWREALIIAILVPLTLCVVLGVGLVLGHTINRITLFALILSLGLLVDDGIVVIENIHRHLQKARTVRDFGSLIVEATNEIGNPTIMATFTVIIAFIPMLFVTGMMGPFMRPIPINVPVAMITSLMLADIAVPYIALRWLRRKAALKEAKEHPTLEEEDKEKPDTLRRIYLAVFVPLQKSALKRNFFFAAVVLLLFGSLLMPLWQFIRPQGMNGPESPFGVSLKMLPDGNVSTFVIQIQTPAGTALPATNRVALEVGRVTVANRYVEHLVTYLGRTGPLSFAGMVRGDELTRGANIAQIVVNLVPKGERPHTAVVGTQVWKALAPVRKQFPETHIMLFLTPPGPPTRAQVVARIFGPDYETLRQIASYVASDFKKVYGMTDVHDSVTATHAEYRIHVDQRKALLSGVPATQVARLVHDYVAGSTIGSVFRPSVEPEDIIVRLNQADRAWIRQVQDLSITNGEGMQVPLSGIVQIRHIPAAKPILTHDEHPVVYVMGDVLGFSPEYSALVLDEILDGQLLPNGVRVTTGNLGVFPAHPDGVSRYQIFWGGDMRLTLNVFRDLGTAFFVALVFIYFLLVGYYQSFMMPIIVMGAIPLTLIGMFPGHWLFHMPFNATSMIGFIALAGIVVRNSLLLIDFILEYREKGYSLEEAVTEAGAVRFRPILLTALAIIFGSAIMVTDPVFGGLAIALMFGTFASTMLTLIVIPLFYEIWQKRSMRH